MCEESQVHLHKEHITTKRVHTPSADRRRWVDTPTRGILRHAPGYDQTTHTLACTHTHPEQTQPYRPEQGK